MQSVTLVGRKWFNKRVGNTYHSVEIIINGTFVHKCEYEYGYGNQYVWTANSWLRENGYVQLSEAELARYPDGSLAGWCEKNNVKYNETCTDVMRKKDL